MAPLYTFSTCYLNHYQTPPPFQSSLFFQTDICIHLYLFLEVIFFSHETFQASHIMSYCKVNYLIRLIDLTVCFVIKSVLCFFNENGPTPTNTIPHLYVTLF